MLLFFPTTRPVLVGWLSMFNAQLSAKNFGRGPRSQEVWEEGDSTVYRYTVTTRMTPALIVNCNESHFKASLVVRDIVTTRT